MESFKLENDKLVRTIQETKEEYFTKEEVEEKLSQLQNQRQRQIEELTRITEEVDEEVLELEKLLSKFDELEMESKTIER